MSESDASWVMVEIEREGARSIHRARLLVIQETRQCWAVLTGDGPGRDSSPTPEYQLDPMLLEEQPYTFHGEPMFLYPETLHTSPQGFPSF